MTPILQLSTAVAMQNATGAAKTITGISKASAAVVTATHDFSAGDYVIIDSVVGMTEINKRVVRVLSVSTTVSFVCEALDSSAFSTYASGGTATKVTSFYSLDNVTGISFPEPQPNKEDVTTVHDNAKKEVFGLDDAATISMPILADPTGTTMAAVRAAAIAKTPKAWKFTFQNGNIMICYAYVAGGRGLDGGAGKVATGQISLALASTEQYFSS